MANTQTAVTYGIDITDRTELVNAIQSTLVFFKGESGIYELAPSATPFMNVFGQIATKKALGMEEEYVEHRGSFLTIPLCYIKTVGNGTGFGALTPDNVEKTGLVLVKTPTGTTDYMDSLKVNDILLFQDFTDSTLTATAIITTVTSAAAGEYCFKILDNAPGFDLDATSGSRTKVFVPSRQAASGGDFAAAAYEKKETRWNGVSIFEDGYEIDDETMNNLQSFDNVQEAVRQIAWGQMRLMRKADLGLLFASSRVGSTPANPFSGYPSTTIKDASGRVLHPSMSIHQAVKSTANGDYSLGGTREFKLTTASSTIDDLENMMKEVHEFNSPTGGSNRMVFCGSDARLALGQIARKSGEYQILPDQKEYGIDWEILKSPFGKWRIAIHDGLAQTPYNNAMFILDKTCIELREYEAMKSEKVPRDKRTNQWDLTHRVGLRVKFPEASTAMCWFN